MNAKRGAKYTDFRLKRVTLLFHLICVHKFHKYQIFRDGSFFSIAKFAAFLFDLEYCSFLFLFSCIESWRIYSVCAAQVKRPYDLLSHVMATCIVPVLPFVLQAGNLHSVKTHFTGIST